MLCPTLVNQYFTCPLREPAFLSEFDTRLRWPTFRVIFLHQKHACEGKRIYENQKKKKKIFAWVYFLDFGPFMWPMLANQTGALVYDVTVTQKSMEAAWNVLWGSETIEIYKWNIDTFRLLYTIYSNLSLYFDS